MKKLGFTLAEVLITLGLVGVISALTLPSFVQSTQNESYAAKLSSTVSSIENALTTMIATEAVVDLSETRFGQELTAGNLGRYLKGASRNKTDYYGNQARPFLTIAGDSTGPDTADFTFETKSGAVLMFRDTEARIRDDEIDPDTLAALGGSVSGCIGSLVIDVNGASQPNRWGRDAFYFYIGTDGLLYPVGSINVSILEFADATNHWNTAGSSFICTDASKGLGCTARLVENNYKVDF